MKRNNDYLRGNQFAKGNLPNKTAFTEGHEPWNKGKKGIHLSPATEFKKGQRGIKHLPVGTVTIRADKNGTKRRWMKVKDPNIWIEYAKYIWEQKHGEIPKALLIHHIDFDSLNDSPDNLAAITRKVHFEIHEIGAMGRKKLADIAKEKYGLFE